jgi:hypothetical protein
LWFHHFRTFPVSTIPKKNKKKELLPKMPDPSVQNGREWEEKMENLGVGNDSINIEQPSTPETKEFEQDSPISNPRFITPHMNDSSDANIVTWDSLTDPANPMNWSALLRWSIITLVSAITFVAGLSSSMFAPSVPALMAEFHSTNIYLGSSVVTIFALGLGTGPLIFAPLSEISGRLPIEHTGNVGFFGLHDSMCEE